MLAPFVNSTTNLLTWRGQTVKLTPAPHQAHVYLIHLSQPLGDPANPKGYAQHYCGSSCVVERRLSAHRQGRSKAAFMDAVFERKIGWQVVRLWAFPSGEEARAFERKLKRCGHNPKQCPLCNPSIAPDPLVALRLGHHPAVSRKPGRRQPIGEARPHFVVRNRSAL